MSTGSPGADARRTSRPARQSAAQRRIFVHSLWTNAGVLLRPPDFGTPSRRTGLTELQFSGMKTFDPARSHNTTCYVHDGEIDTVHAESGAGLKTAHGRIPARGLPRTGAAEGHSVRRAPVPDDGPGRQPHPVGRRTGDG